MSRLFAVIISMFYVVGGLLTGYHCYAMRLQAQILENGIDLAFLSEFLQTDYVSVGPLMLALALFFHLSQIKKARRMNTEHNDTEFSLSKIVDLNKNKLAVLEAEVAKNRNLVDFCQSAISKSATLTKNLNVDVEPAKDYLLESKESSAPKNVIISDG